MFTHFLITRFNLRKTDWTTNKNNQAVLTDLWLKNRFELFSNYCFPSVASQVNDNFEWLVYFDTTTPELYRNRIKELQVEFPNFKPQFIDGMTNLLPSIYEYINQYDSEHIITSTLDNDDCIGKYYIDEVQKQFDSQDYLAIDFIDGFTIKVTNPVRIGNKVHLFNPFISLIEKNNNPITVYKKGHTDWKKEQRLKTIKGIKIWSSIIHEENMVNDFTGFGAVDIDSFFNDFKISKSKEHHIREYLNPVSRWRLSSFKNYINSYQIVFSKRLKRFLGIYRS